jgi:hypothetical protein
MIKLNQGQAWRIAGLALATTIAGFGTAAASQDKAKEEKQVIEQRIVIRHVGGKDGLRAGEVPQPPIPGQAINCPGEKFVVDSTGGTDAKKETVKLVLCADNGENMLAALERAEGDIQKQDIPADRKAEILGKIREKITELRAKG